MLEKQNFCDKNKLVETLQELVKIPSLSGAEAQVAEYVSKRLNQLNLKPEVDKYYNVIATIGSGRTLLLNAHLDTVPPGKRWTKDPYSGEVAGGKVPHRRLQGHR